MSDTIICDFVFVPAGTSFPSDWAERHPDYITLPARFTGSPAFMERMFGKQQPAGSYVFDKSAPPMVAFGGANPASVQKADAIPTTPRPT